MLRAVVTLLGLGLMGISDFRSREFDERPVVALWALASIPAMVEYYSVWTVMSKVVEFWAIAYAAIVAGFYVLYRLGYTEDGDVFGLAFAFFFNVVSPFNPFGDFYFQLVFMFVTAALLLIPVAWGRKRIPVSKLLEEPKKYVYVRGISVIDGARRKSPPGSFTLDYVVPKLREMVERGELSGSEEVVVEMGTPLLFYLFISYITSVIIWGTLVWLGVLPQLY